MWSTKTEIHSLYKKIPLTWLRQENDFKKTHTHTYIARRMNHPMYMGLRSGNFFFFLRRNREITITLITSNRMEIIWQHNNTMRLDTKMEKWNG